MFNYNRILGKICEASHTAVIHLEDNIVRLRQNRRNYILKAISGSDANLPISLIYIKSNTIETYAISVELPDRDQ